MSLVSTYVQSQSGRWYVGPTIRGDDFFVCWDDDEPIELVVKEGTSVYDITKYLIYKGWDIHIDHENETCGMRIFGQDENGYDKFEDAHAYFLSQENGPPDELLPQSKALDYDPLEHPRPGVYYENKAIAAEHHDLKADLGMYDD